MDKPPIKNQVPPMAQPAPVGGPVQSELTEEEKEVLARERKIRLESMIGDEGRWPAAYRGLMILMGFLLIIFGSHDGGASGIIAGLLCWVSAQLSRIHFQLRLPEIEREVDERWG